MTERVIGGDIPGLVVGNVYPQRKDLFHVCNNVECCVANADCRQMYTDKYKQELMGEQKQVAFQLFFLEGMYPELHIIAPTLPWPRYITNFLYMIDMKEM